MTLNDRADSMKIKHVERLALNIPFYCDRVTRAMHRAQTHDESIYLYQIEADTGIVHMERVILDPPAVPGGVPMPTAWSG